MEGEGGIFRKLDKWHNGRRGGIQQWEGALLSHKATN